MNKVFVLGRDKARNAEVAGQNLLVQFVRVRVFERQIATSHCVKDNTAGPDVAAKTVVPLACDHFRGGVARGPTSSF